MRRDEIVKALRCFASEDNCPVDECNKKCPYWMENDKFDIDNPNAEISDGHQLCCAAADMLEQDAEKTSWISVKDRLPEDDATYLVYGRNGYGIVFAVYYGDGEWLTCDDLTNITRFVTHWMPLPEPPKEEAK